RSRPLLLLVVLLLVGALPASGQQLVLGSRLRIRTPCPSQPGCAPVVGTLLSQSGSDLVLADVEGATHDVRLGPASTVEVFRGRRGHALTGLGIGAGIGALISLSRNCLADCDLRLIVLTAGGALDGVIIGALIRSDRWTPVVRPTMAAGGFTGGLALGARLLL